MPPDNEKQKMEFSKGLTISFVALFVSTVFFCIYTWLTMGTFPGEILSTVAIATGAVLTGYFGKSGYENGYKIKSSYPVNQRSEW